MAGAAVGILLKVRQSAPNPAPNSSKHPPGSSAEGRTHRQFRRNGRRNLPPGSLGTPCRGLSPPHAPLTASAPPFTTSCRASPPSATPLTRAGRHVPHPFPFPGTSWGLPTQSHRPRGLRECWLSSPFPWEFPPIPPHRGIALLAAASTARPAQRPVAGPPPSFTLLLGKMPWKCVFPGKTTSCTLDPVLAPIMTTSSMSPGASLGRDGFGSLTSSRCSIQPGNSPRFPSGKSWDSWALLSTFCCHSKTPLGHSDPRMGDLGLSSAHS